MSLPRFYCPGLSAKTGALVRMPEAAAHHAVRVLRLRAGDGVVLFDGEGAAWQGKIAEAGRHVAVSVDAELSAANEPVLDITLVQALPGGDKMDWVVQKAAELGVKAIQPITSQRSVVRLAGARAEKRVVHWQEVAASACEQCGRNVVPTVLPILDLNQYLAQSRQNTEIRLLLAPESGQRLRDMAVPEAPLSLLVGPEGGFAPEEFAAANVAGWTPLRLGPRVLRSETAGLAALAAIMALWGDM